MGELLLTEWSKEWKGLNKDGKKYVDMGGQHIRPVLSGNRDMLETIKYGSKIFTDPEMRKRGFQKSHVVYLKSIYNVLDAFDGLRIFDRFGFNVPKSNETKESGENSKLTYNYQRFIYQFRSQSWVDLQSGEELFDYKPSRELRHILNERIDYKSQ